MKGNLRSRIVGEVLVLTLGAFLIAFALFANDAWSERHLVASYYFYDPRQIARVHAERWFAGIMGMVLIFALRPRITRFFQRRTLSSLAGGALRSSIAIVLALIVSDGILRWKRAHAAHDTHAADPVHPTPSYEGREDLDATLGTRAIHYATNADGVRTRASTDVIDRAAPTILFSGESVTFGYGLNFEDTVPAMVAADTGLQTVNLGMCASANDEELARAERFLPQFSRPKALVTFVVYDWIYRNIGIHRERLALDGDGKLIKVSAEPELLWSSPVWEFLRDIYHQEEIEPLTRAILARTAELARAHDAYPLFVMTQAGARSILLVDGRPRIERALIEGQSFTSIAVDLDPHEVVEDHTHPNAKATRALADAIERSLGKSGVIPEVEGAR